MKQQPVPAALEAQQIDPEVFRRVWARVMPDQSRSPIAVDSPVPSASRAPASPSPARSPTPPAKPKQQPSAPPPQEEPGQPLKRLMDLSREGIVFSGALVQRTGNRGRPLSALVRDHQRALRQLRAAYFLVTGRNYQPAGAPPPRNISLPMALREQFLWEQRWAAACLEAAERMSDSTLRELCRELAQDASLHTRTILGVLEGMQGTVDRPPNSGVN